MHEAHFNNSHCIQKSMSIMIMFYLSAPLNLNKFLSNLSTATKMILDLRKPEGRRWIEDESEIQAIIICVYKLAWLQHISNRHIFSEIVIVTVIFWYSFDVLRCTKHSVVMHGRVLTNTPTPVFMLCWYALPVVYLGESIDIEPCPDLPYPE